MQSIKTARSCDTTYTVFRPPLKHKPASDKTDDNEQQRQDIVNVAFSVHELYVHDHQEMLHVH